MLHNLLKTSVSVLVLLGALSSLDPSYGMDDHKRKNEDSFSFDPNNKKSKKEAKSKYPIDWILTSFEYPKKHTLAPRVFKNAGNDDDFSKLPKNIILYVFRYLDPQSTLNALLVCTKWNQLITASQNDLQEKWEYTDKNPEFLRQFFSHPLNVLFIQEKLAPLFPYQPLNMSFDEPAEMRIEEVPPQNIQLLDNLIKAIKSSPGAYNLLSKTSMNRSSYRDFQEIGFVARLIKEVPALQEMLWEFLDKTMFDMETFDMETLPHQRSFLQHMMALKFLALSEDKKAKERMLDFIIRCETDPRSLVLFAERKKGHPLLFLPSFTDDQELLSKTLNDLNDFLNSRKREDLKMQLHMDLNQLENIGKYIFSTQPQLKDEEEINFYYSLKDIYSLQNKKMPLLAELDENTLQGLKTPEDFIRQANLFYIREQYEEVEKIFDKALIKFADAPSRFFFLKEKVDVCLSSKNEKKFTEAAEGIETLIKAFTEGSVLNTPFAEGSNETICLPDIHIMRATLEIFQGDFEKAYQSLQHGFRNTEEDIKAFDYLVRALKSQLKHIPEEIIEFLRSDQPLYDFISHTHDIDSFDDREVYNLILVESPEKDEFNFQYEEFAKNISELKKEQNKKDANDK